MVHRRGRKWGFKDLIFPWKRCSFWSNGGIIPSLPNIMIDSIEPTVLLRVLKRFYRAFSLLNIRLLQLYRYLGNSLFLTSIPMVCADTFCWWESPSLLINRFVEIQLKSHITYPNYSRWKKVVSKFRKQMDFTEPISNKHWHVQMKKHGAYLILTQELPAAILWLKFLSKSLNDHMRIQLRQSTQTGTNPTQIASIQDLWGYIRCYYWSVKVKNVS